MIAMLIARNVLLFSSTRATPVPYESTYSIVYSWILGEADDAIVCCAES
jgi:hypothetical protein